MSNTSSFLPDDYLDQKASRRTNFICLILFSLVMLGVFLAFFVTLQMSREVKAEQALINQRYQAAADEIREFLALEEQKQEMVQKAELAASLVERVPRSVLLAELINRMPDQLSLLEFKLESEEIKQVSGPDARTTKDNRLAPKRANTRAEAAVAAEKPRPPKYRTDVTLVGVAPTGLQVSRYLAELNTFSLLKNVRLVYAEERQIEGQTMQEFELRMKLDQDADIRSINPLIRPRSISDPTETATGFGPGFPTDQEEN